MSRVPSSALTAWTGVRVCCWPLLTAAESSEGKPQGKAHVQHQVKELLCKLCELLHSSCCILPGNSAAQ